MAKKTIPCRVCGKQFQPCGFCQSRSDIFRWRNFACSKECAQKYIAETIAYREKNNQEQVQLEVIMEPSKISSSEEENLNINEDDIPNTVKEEHPIVEENIFQNKKKKKIKLDDLTE